MWRTYKEKAGVALVMNNSVFLSSSEALKAYSSPVSYLTDSEFAEQLGLIGDNIDRNREFLQTLDRNTLISYVFHAFRFAILCTKHPGFKEEREWRVVYTPKFEQSARLRKEVQVIRGIPQPIYKIPLENVPEEGLFGAEIRELLERIIIGPTEYALAATEAFEHLLVEAGVKNAESRIVISEIPLR